MKVQVRLTPQEAFQAAIQGVIRRHKGIFDEKPQMYGLDENRANVWDFDINGAMAEMAVAKYTGHYWSGIQKTNSNDVGFYEVRSTTYHSGHLLMHDRDSDHTPYILACVKAPNVILLGWIWGRKAKEKKYFRETNGRTAYWVPQEDLQPMEKLPDGKLS